MTMSVISQSVIVTVVSPFHVSPFRYSMCHRFGYMCVAVLVCRRFDQLPLKEEEEHGEEEEFENG